MTESEHGRNEMKCAICSHPMAVGGRFCGKCGAAVSAEAVKPAPPSGLAFADAAAGPGAAAAAAWDDMKKQFPGLIERAKNILLKPSVEWPIIAAEAPA